MSESTESYDCIVIGGGPAGSTVATLVADAGHKVLVIERAKFPRFQIGESLMPETYWTFERLGMLPKLRDSKFIKKYSVQFVAASGRETRPVYFDERDPRDCSQTWQVLRSEFDEMLLDNAAEHGATVWQESNVNEILLEPSATDDLPRATGVIVTRKGEKPRRINAKVIVDASGTHAMLSKKLKIRTVDPNLRKAAIFAQYKGCSHDLGKNSGATLVLSTPQDDGWFWYIPLPDGVTSVGVVGDLSRLSNKLSTPEQTLEQEVANCAGLAPRMTKARRVSEVELISMHSYRSTRCAGDGWVLVGDAFGFLDPIYASGVFLALKGGEMAADAINDALAIGKPDAINLSNWGDKLSDGMQTIRNFVYAFYTPGFSFGRFVRAYPDKVDDVARVLVGDVFRPEVKELFKALGTMVPFPESTLLERPKATRMESAGR